MSYYELDLLSIYFPVRLHTLLQLHKKHTTAVTMPIAKHPLRSAVLSALYNTQSQTTRPWTKLNWLVRFVLSFYCVSENFVKNWFIDLLCFHKTDKRKKYMIGSGMFFWCCMLVRLRCCFYGVHSHLPIKILRKTKTVKYLSLFFSARLSTRTKCQVQSCRVANIKI